MTITQRLKRNEVIMIMLNLFLPKNVTAVNFTARLAQAKLATKADIADFIKKTDFDNKLF